VKWTLSFHRLTTCLRYSIKKRYHLKRTQLGIMPVFKARIGAKIASIKRNRNSLKIRMRNVSTRHSKAT
jgi:hypothetical protein